jgi:hypothetical protein
VNNTVHTIDEGSNSWDDGTYGNYWSDQPDYNDWNGDGIVDTPVVIDSDSRDNYPLIVPWGDPFNRPIKLDIIADDEIEVGKYLNITFSSTDPDGDPPFYEIYSNPETDFLFENNTGFFSYLGKQKDIGQISFEVRVYDQNGSRYSSKFTVDVLHKNYPPVVEPMDMIYAYPGESKRVKINFSDPNNDDVNIYVIQTDAPFFINVDHEGYLSFRANEDQVGRFHAILNFSDNNGTHTLFRVEITIIPHNVPPEIVPIKDQIGYINEKFEIDVEVIDPNSDIFTFHINYSGEGSSTIDNDGHVEIVPSDADIGYQTVLIRVSDNNGSYDEEGFRLRIDDTIKPTAVITGSLIVDEGEDLKLHGLGSTDNGKIVRYLWTFVDVVDREIDGPYLNYSFRSKGIHEITLTVYDEWNNFGEATVTVDVLDSISPIADAGEDRMIPVGAVFTFNSTGSSDNGVIVKWEWSFEYDGGTIKLDGAFPEFAFDIAGEYTVLLTVFDQSGNTGEGQVVITVTDKGILTGTVLDRDGNPIYCVKVTVVDEYGYEYETVTEGGEFSINVTMGTVSWTLSKDGYRSVSGTSEIFPMGITEIDLSGKFMEKEDPTRPDGGSGGFPIFIVIISAVILFIIIVAVGLLVLLRKVKDKEESHDKSDSDLRDLPS